VAGRGAECSVHTLRMGAGRSERGAWDTAQSTKVLYSYEEMDLYIFMYIKIYINICIYMYIHI